MSAWLEHVKKTMKANPDKSLKDVLKMAKKTYKKVASSASKLVSGTRRKHKTSKHRKGKRGGATRKHRRGRKQRGGGCGCGGTAMPDSQE